VSKNFSVWHYLKYFRFNSIFLKNFVIILSLVATAIISIGFIFSYYNGQIINEEISDYNADRLSRMKDTVDALFLSADELALNFSVDPDVKKFISMNRAEVNDDYSDFVETVKRIQTRFGIYSLSGSMDNSVFIYSENLDYVVGTSGNTGMRVNVFDDEFYVNQTKTLRGKNFRITNTSFKNEDSISIFRAFPIDAGAKKTGVIQINIEIRALRQLINSKESKYNNIFITEGDTVVYSLDDKNVGRKKDDVREISDAEIDGDRVIRRNFDGEKQVLSTADGEYNNLKYILITHLQEYTNKTETMNSFIFYLVILLFILSVIASFAASIFLFRPIDDIYSLLESPKDTPEKKRNLGEISRIKDFILILMGENSKIKSELVNRVRALKEAQAQALQSQISPHFLYNTLENIKWMTVELTNSENDASEMIVKLSQLLRMSLSGNAGLITADAEITMTRLYIDIQCLRYSDKIDVIWDIDGDLLKFKIPKFTLQPLVENAIYHGVRPKSGKGIIKISLKETAGLINITVSDNGIGMNKEVYERIVSELSDNISVSVGNKRIGIQNVHRRIKLLYGDEFGVSLENQGGVTVNVKFPCRI
jgi:two-component system sensor histidine kinase YesM